MSFFKDLKDDAVDDKILSGESSDDDLVKVEDDETATDLSEEELEDEIVLDEDIISDGFEEPYDELLIKNILETEGGDDESVTEDDIIEEKPVGAASVAKDTDREEDNQVTVITKGTTINGSIVSDCSLNVMGTINGDIECIGKLTISGNVVGNSIASDVYINAKRMEGNIDSDGSVKIGLGTVVIGDIKAGSTVIAGAVKGELDVRGPVIIDSTAIIKGNIKAKSIQMNNGAVVEGFCTLSYSSVDIEGIFE